MNYVLMLKVENKQTCMRGMLMILLDWKIKFESKHLRTCTKYEQMIDDKLKATVALLNLFKYSSQHFPPIIVKLHKLLL